MGAKCIFSVGPIQGFRKVPAHPGADYFNVSQNEPARDRRFPYRPLVNVRFRSKHDSFWGPGKDYISPVQNNPSWRKVKHLVEAAMKCTGDTHHQFLESIEFTGKFHEDGCEYVDLWMGS